MPLGSKDRRGTTPGLAPALDVRHRYRWDVDGRVVEVEQIVCRADDWPSYEESRSPLWSAWDNGGLVTALLLPAALRGVGGPR